LSSRDLVIHLHEEIGIKRVSERHRRVIREVEIEQGNFFIWQELFRVEQRIEGPTISKSASSLLTYFCGF
jgi:hypothetical protein